VVEPLGAFTEPWIGPAFLEKPLKFRVHCKLILSVPERAPRPTVISDGPRLDLTPVRERHARPDS
jgi:hypothetical protein